MNKQGPTGIEWRSVPGYEGLYEVSNAGEVRRIAGSPKCHKTRVLSPAYHHGYLSVALSKNADVKSVGVHRLVAWAFIGPQENLWVNHRNGIKSDNRVSNIEYLTPGENTKHAYRIGLQPSRAGEGNGHSRLTEHKVRLIRRWAGSGVPRKEIVKRIGASQTTVRDIIVGASWKHIL